MDSNLRRDAANIGLVNFLEEIVMSKVPVLLTLKTDALAFKQEVLMPRVFGNTLVMVSFTFLLACSSTQVFKGQSPRGPASGEPEEIILDSDGAIFWDDGAAPKFKDPKYSVQSWDTTVAAYLIDPNYITESKDVSIRVRTKFDRKYGSVEETNGPVNARVMTRMNTNRFFNILEESFGVKPVSP